MPKHTQRSSETGPRSLGVMQNSAFEKIAADAEHYISQEHSTAVYVQDTLFAQGVAQEHDDQGLRDRAASMETSEGDIILFPHELDDLRSRAAYHGAGLSTEPEQNIPRLIRYRLSDNLSNYPPDMDYEQQTFPWSYKFTMGALRSVLFHDFKIAASDNADGDLGRLCKEQEDDEFA